VKNNFQLVDKLNGTYFEAGYQLASLDVVSLFTNVPAESREEMEEYSEEYKDS